MDGVSLIRVLVNGSFVLATCAFLYLLVSVVLPVRLKAYKMQPDSLPRQGDIPRDFFWAAVALFVLGAANLLLITWLHERRPLILFYDVRENWLRFVISFLAFFLLSDAYRYWTHRLQHVPFLYRRFHSLHHRSVTPTPVNGFSGHPVDIAINLLGPILLMAIHPVHVYVIMAYGWFITVGHILRHLGYDFISHHIARVPLLNTLVLARFHDYHHTDPDTNFTNMFTWWDYWMNTAHEKSRNDSGLPSR